MNYSQKKNKRTTHSNLTKILKYKKKKKSTKLLCGLVIQKQGKLSLRSKSTNMDSYNYMYIILFLVFGAIWVSTA